MSFVDGFSDQLKKELKDYAPKNPFETYEYYQCLENSGCASENSGWQPNHNLQASVDGNLIIPIYKKTNSYGEFIFDYSWANAFARYGIEYYPKLVSSVPFTPCHSSKLIGNTELLEDAITEVENFMSSEGIQSWHILFPSDDDLLKLENHGFIKRFGYRYIWKNYDYQSFSDYLERFKSRQRKNILKERKSIKDEKIEFEIMSGSSINEDAWQKLYSFYCQTYFDRGQRPYLNLKFFKMIADKKEIKPVIFFAKYKDDFVGASLCFEGSDTLYGRHWGSNILLKNLHFEACFYQGIEYCINNGLSYFDPGIQGEHKLRRGFEVSKKVSMHMISNKDFRDAIASFCKDEENEVNRYIESCKAYTPFSIDYKIE